MNDYIKLTERQKLEILKFMTVFASENKENVRSYLKNIIIEKDKIYATNGNILCLIENIDLSEFQGKVTTKSIKDAYKIKNLGLIKKQENSEEYPDIFSLIPGTYSFNESCISCTYLSVVFTALDKLERSLGIKCPSVNIKQISDLSPNIFTKYIKEDGKLSIKFTILIMPIRQG